MKPFIQKKSLLLSGVLLLCLLLPGHCPAKGGQGAGGPGGAALKKIAGGLYAFIGPAGAANSGFVVTENGVVVIDSQGPRPLALKLKEKIKEVSGLPVIYVINTHYHGDHTFGNQYFNAARSIIAHRETRRALIEKEKEQKAVFKRFFGPESLDGFTLTPPDITFSEKMTLKIGGKTLLLIHTGPAHTGGDIYVYMPGERVVFTGDILYRKRLPWLADGNFEGALKALDELLALGAEVYIPGHGEVASREDVVEFRGYLTALEGAVKKMMADGAALAEVKERIKLPAYGSYMKYREWLPLNAEKVYNELKKERRR
ncbi:MAG: MBL fold metallo-hydrolase [Thermodesulfobacteriota bacterium]